MRLIYFFTDAMDCISNVFSTIIKFFTSFANFCSDCSIWLLDTVKSFIFSFGSEDVGAKVDNTLAHANKQVISNNVDNSGNFLNIILFSLRFLLSFLIIMFLVDVVAKLIVRPKQKRLMRALKVSDKRVNKLTTQVNGIIDDTMLKQMDREIYEQLNK